METDIGRFLTYLREDNRFSENTVSAYKTDLLQLIAFLTNPVSEHRATTLPIIRDWRSLTYEHLAAFLQSLRDCGYAKSTIARKGAAVKAFAEYLAIKGEVKGDIAVGLEAPQVGRDLPTTISREDAERILQAPASVNPERADGLRDRAMLQMVYRTGMRASELVNLNLDDVDLENKTARCVRPNGQDRVVPLPDEVVAATAKYTERGRPFLAPCDAQALFLNHRGKRLSRQGFWLIIKAHARALGMRHITPHTLRHSWALHALEDGMPLRDVQAQLGHASRASTNVYRDLLNQQCPCEEDQPGQEQQEP